jgi:hypothetical protein
MGDCTQPLYPTLGHWNEKEIDKEKIRTSKTIAIEALLDTVLDYYKVQTVECMLLE